MIDGMIFLITFKLFFIAENHKEHNTDCIPLNPLK